MYNKLFTKILDSSIWLEPVTTRIVWITLLAAMDEDGYAHFSAIENLANRARVTVTECNAAVEALMAPDQNSADPEFDGRRVERVPGGFIILNAVKYRNNFSAATRREQTRLRVQKHREKKASNANVTQGNDAVLKVTIPNASVHASVQKKGECEGKTEPLLITPVAEAGLEVPEKLRHSEFLKAFNLWIPFRLKKEKPKDPKTMFQHQLSMLAEYSVPEATEIVNASIRNNWQGLFRPKDGHLNGKPQKPFVVGSENP